MIKECEYERCNYVLVGVDECGDEFYAGWWCISADADLDEDFFELWQCMKRDKAHEHWQEARGFYFEDRRHWNDLIEDMLYGM